MTDASIGQKITAPATAPHHEMPRLDTGNLWALAPATIVPALTYVRRGAPPRQALAAALGARDDVAPALLELLATPPLEIQDRIDAAPDDDTAFALLEFGMLLLAAWREPAAWAAILDLFVSDNDVAMEIVGPGFEEMLPAILVRCHDGSDPAYLERLIATEAFDPLFRQACVATYHGLVTEGTWPRDRLVKVLAHLLADAENAPPAEWASWLAFRAAELREPSLRPAINRVRERQAATASQDPVLDLVAGTALDEIYATPAEDIAASIVRDDLFADVVETICTLPWVTTAAPAASDALDDDSRLWRTAEAAG